MTSLAQRLLCPADIEPDAPYWRRETKYLADMYSKMTKFVMEHNLFTSGKRIYRQIQGTAMGTNMAPEFANIYMGMAEHNLLKTMYDVEGCLYLRYIDDILLIGKRSQLDRIVLQQQFLNLPLTVNWLEPLTQDVPFLDLLLSLRDSKIVYELYRKPINTYQYLEWDSGHPLATKKGFVIGEIVRIFRNCSDRETALKHVDFFRSKIRLRGYPPKLTEKWIKGTILSIQNQPLSDTRRSKETALSRRLKTFYLKVKYNPTWDVQGGILKQRLEVILRDEGLVQMGKYPRHLKVRVLLSKGRVRNILDYTSSNLKKVLDTHHTSPWSQFFTSFNPDPSEEARYKAGLNRKRSDLVRRLGQYTAKRVQQGRQRAQRSKRACHSVRSRRRVRASPDRPSRGLKRPRYE